MKTEEAQRILANMKTINKEDIPNFRNLHLEIRKKPWWFHPLFHCPCVGLPEYQFTDSGMLVKIQYEEVDGQKLFPGLYYCSRQLSKLAPLKPEQGVYLRTIKIQDLKKVIE